MRALLHESKLEQSFWGEAALYSAYLCNITSHKSLNGSTPFEMLFKTLPDVSKLRVFGCEAQIYVQNEARKKRLEKRPKMGIFVEIENGLYRILDTEFRCVLVSEHVIMDETKFPATLRTTQISSKTDDEREQTQVLDLYGDVNQNKIESDDAAQDASDVTSSHPLRMTESLDIGRDMSETDDEHVPTRRYPERNRVTPKRFAFAARKVSDTDMPNVREALDSDHRYEWERVIRLELKPYK